MADSRTGTEYSQDEFGASCSARKRGSALKTKQIHNVRGTQEPTGRAPNGQTGTT